jgi:hypothetical protein
MQIDKDKLKKALMALQEDKAGTYYTGNFISLLQDSRGAQYFLPEGVSQKVNIHQLAKRLLLIYTDLLSIVSLSKRLELEQLLRREGNTFRISDELWRWYASLDIDLFFGKYRSIFDNIAQLIKAVSANKTPNSFYELFGKAETRSLLMDQQYIQLIQECDWFKDTKNIRDSIEHHAAETVVDYDNKKILFMVSVLDQGFTNLPGKNIIVIPEITEENGFSNFESYFGIHVGYMVWLLEEMSTLIRENIVLHLPGATGIDKCYHPGFGPLRNWINTLLKEVK